MAGFDPDVFNTGETARGFDPDVFTTAPAKPDAAAAKKAAAPVNRAYQAGRNAQSWGEAGAQGLASVMNGPLMGFADEIGGGIQAGLDKLLGAQGSFGDRYKERRDTIRGMQDAQKDENPWTTGLTQAAASAPMLALSPAALGARMFPGTFGRVAGAVPSGVIGNTGRSMVAGAGYGAVAGAGNSTADTHGGVAEDAGRGALMGAATGAVATPVLAGAGGVAQSAGSAMRDRWAASHAREKIAEAMARDTTGVFASGMSDPSRQLARRLTRFGDDAAVVDAGGKNTLQLLDTLATLPGRTKEAVAGFQRQRAATAGARMRTAADEGLDTGGQRLATTIDSLEAQRSAAARPLYDQLEGVAVTVDDDLLRLLSRTRGHHGEAQNLHRLDTGEEVALSSLQSGQQVPFKMLDSLKQSLDDAASAAKRAGNNKMGLKVDDARVALLAKLDDLAPKVNGQSVYKAARDAYAGPSQLRDAAEAGRKAINQDGAGIREVLRGFSTSEQEAFRIGAFEGLREKLGTQRGRTSVQNMWQEETTRERLRPLFGTEREFREFAAAVAVEARKKRVQGVDQGSKSATRLAGMGDLDAGALPQIATAAAGVKTGNLLGAIAPVINAWNRVATPQSVRDEMGRMLLQKGPEARQFITENADLLSRINRNNGLLSDTYGLTGGLIGGNLAPAMPLGR